MKYNKMKNNKTENSLEFGKSSPTPIKYNSIKQETHLKFS